MSDTVPAVTQTSFRQHRFRRPPGATEIILVRHGESEPAVPGHPFPLLDGHGDPGLAPEGLEQAEAVAERLVHEHLDDLYVTNLRRTQQTAAPLARRLRRDPRVEADLREVNLGEWEGGMLRQRVAAGDPLVARMYAEQSWDVIPGAEPGHAFAARVRAGIERIAVAHRDQRVAVFTHGGVIGQALGLAAGTGPLTFAAVDNGAVSHLVVVGDRWVIRRFNDTSHLPGGLDRPNGGEQPPGDGFSA